MLTLGRYSRLARSTRGYLRTLRRTLLTKSFAMENEWANRHKMLDTLALGGDYEWIAAVQKKFVGGGIASAVDVDAAICAAEEEDQMADSIDLMYRLRHTPNTADTLPSTEYAMVRFMLKYNATESLFKVLTDPINYGVFLNEHSACLTIDHLLKAANYSGAAKIATVVMQQEMLSNVLLNSLSIYAVLRWLSLPAEGRVFDETVQPVMVEEEVSEEETRTVKMAYLKNEYNDGHFDLTEPEKLVGKTLLWTVRHTKLDKSIVNSIQLLGHLMYGNMEKFVEMLKEGKVVPSALEICKSHLEKKLEKAGEERKQYYEGLMESLDKCECTETDKTMHAMVEEYLKSIQIGEEQKLVQEQNEQFKQWADRRTALIGAQAEHLNCRLRLEQIQKQRAELEDQLDVVTFFEHRMRWEDIAKRKDEVFDELRERKSDGDVSEDEYSMALFENVRRGGREESANSKS